MQNFDRMEQTRVLKIYSDYVRTCVCDSDQKRPIDKLEEIMQEINGLFNHNHNEEKFRATHPKFTLVTTTEIIVAVNPLQNKQ